MGTQNRVETMEFEKNLKALEEIVEKMSQGQLSLSEGLKSFKEGMKLVKKCQVDLTHAEQSVEQLIKVHEDGKVETQVLNPTKKEPDFS